MKIGIITHWWTKENYGQILQCYAFQRYLMDCGHEPFLIRYYPDAMFGSFGKRVLRILYRVISFLFSASRRRFWCGIRRRAFPQFIRENICQTKKVYRSYVALSGAKEIVADLYSTGSDIVWGWFPLSDEGRPFFLDFGPSSAKRIAYSASFGDWGAGPEYQRFAGPLIRKLSAVGVRELRGVQLCAEMGRTDAVCVMDPVFLLKRSQWRQIFDIPNNREGVFSYLLQSSVAPKFLLELSQSLRRYFNARLRITTVYSVVGFPRDLLLNPTIPEWVRLVGASQFVLTNSFHCTVLAILLHTPFAVVLKSGGRGMDDRILSILGRVGLMDRVYDQTKNSVEEIVSREIDWGRVDVNIEHELAESLEYLKGVGIC